MTIPQAATTNADWMGGRKCDIVFHDGAHTRDAVYHDIGNLRQLVSVGAMLLVDDCAHKYNYYGPVVAGVKDSLASNWIQNIEDVYFPTYSPDGDLDWKKSRFVCKGQFVPDKEL